MKQFLSALLAIIMLLAVIPATALADDRTGLQNEWMVTEDVEHPIGGYLSEKLLEQIPATIEAWVYIPQDVYAESVGTVIGNYHGKNKDTFTFTIEANGLPQVTINKINDELVYGFANAVISPDTWTHIAIVYDENAMQLRCYLNGQLGDSVDLTEPFSKEILTSPICIAAHRFAMFSRGGFRGTLGDITVYADIRTEQEIAEDCKAPALQDADLLLHYDLAKATFGSDIADESGNGYDLRFERVWLTQEEMDEILAKDDKEYTYSIAFLPDIQYTTERYPDRMAAPFDYLLQNQQIKNIEYLITVGDLTNSNTEAEWERFKAQTDKLDGKLPYSLVRGDHDAFINPIMPFFDQYYNNTTPYYQYVQKNGGFFAEDSVQNTYHLFTAGKVDYLLLNLDFGAGDAVLEWADGILTKYADRRVIVATHGYLLTNGAHLFAETPQSPSSYMSFLNDGDDLWDKLIRKHANISMVVCGHWYLEGIAYSTATGDNGNTVHQLLINAQSTDDLIGGAGFVPLMHFTEDGRYARVEYYSATQEKYFKESVSWLQLDFGEWSGSSNNATTFILIGVAALLVAGAAVAVIVLTKKKKANA